MTSRSLATARSFPVLWAALTLTVAGCGPQPPAVSGTVRSSASVDLVLFKDGRGTVTTAAFSTAAANELLLAFVSSDGPSGSAQTATVSGAGLTWTRVARANVRAGTSEIWKASAPSPLANVTVTSVPSRSGYDQSLTVVALGGAAGTGAGR